jgi:hypothetical protein
MIKAGSKLPARASREDFGPGDSGLEKAVVICWKY